MASPSPTYYGYIDSVYDALLVVEACLRGVLGSSHRRLVDKETEHLIRSGNVFAYTSNSQIRRWTDGKSWSASRVARNFLQYRELEKIKPRRGCSKTQTTALYLKDGGLIKKTIRIDTGDFNYHLVSYYTSEDIANCVFNMPSNDPLFENMSPRVALLKTFPRLREEFGTVVDQDIEPDSRQIKLPIPIHPTYSRYRCGHCGFKAGHVSLRQYSLFATETNRGQDFLSDIGSTISGS